jgi:hypothetical protein
MYSIFHPLDPNEPLPRELLLEGRRHRLMDIRHLEIAGALYLPALILGILAFGAVHMSLVVAFILAGLLLAGFFAFVVAFRTD